MQSLDTTKSLRIRSRCERTALVRQRRYAFAACTAPASRSAQSVTLSRQLSSLQDSTTSLKDLRIPHPLGTATDTETFGRRARRRTLGLSTRGQQALLPTTAYHATPPATSICALGTAHAAPAGQSDVFSCCRAVHPIPQSRQLPARADGPAGALYSRRSGHTVQASVRTAAGS